MCSHHDDDSRKLLNMPAEDDTERSSPQQFCLRWNNYQSNLTSCFDELLQSESFVDVTLACDSKSLKAHKVVLSACSPYFQTLFMENPCRHPIIIMKDVKYDDVKAVVDFMYRGEINVSQEQLPALLKVAETLKIRGLTDVGGTGLQSTEAPRAPKRPETTESSLAGGKSSRMSTPQSPLPPVLPHTPQMPLDQVEIRPGIAEMIREEERAKLIENSQPWFGASTSTIADSYQYQLQSMWQKCWNTNQSLVHNLRFRERGPLKSWRPETMAEAIFSVLKEGLSLSQAARKYDIPYPTFVLYANRVHNMLGPSADGGADLRPKGRGRPQRILLGVWPDEHIRGVIRAVVFRDNQPPAHHIKEEPLPIYPSINDGLNSQNYSGLPCGNGRDAQVSPNSAAAAVAAVAHGLRRQMCNMVVASQRSGEPGVQLSVSSSLSSPRLPSPLTAGLESPMCSPPPLGHTHDPPQPKSHALDPFRPFITPRPEYSYERRTPGIASPRATEDKQLSNQVPVKVEPPAPTENM